MSNRRRKGIGAHCTKIGALRRKIPPGFSPCGISVFWRKEWDLNPRYGITVYRISSPAHSTSLPSFRSSHDETMNLTERAVFCQTANEKKDRFLRSDPSYRHQTELVTLSGGKHRLPSDEAFQRRSCTDEELPEPSRYRRRSGSFRERQRGYDRQQDRNRSTCERTEPYRFHP